MENILVVFNYNAGRKKAIKYKKILHKFLFKRGYSFKFVSVQDFQTNDFSEYKTIIAVGGDGTVNKVAQIAALTDKTLGIIPCGTANLLAAKLGISTNIKKALRTIQKKNIKEIDALKINDLQCILRCGFGYDSDIICKTPQTLKNKFGYFAYFIAGILFALRLKSKSYQITCDDNTFNIDASCIIIGNASNMYRNIVYLADNSQIDDGLLDIFILKAQNPFSFFWEFLRIIFGIRINNPRAKYLKAKSVNIKNSWAVCHIDGEKTKLNKDIEINVIPGAVKVFSN
ncbi:MAG: diacylglycerol kinase family lipid kinase [bacterium]|nr:diacylglycerol kinase family lipid kinase [bacterium]